ncbi:MAG: response regulator transcription factor [Elusimicrobia bacterium]|nr:response regulator transcription factor [Elusimicrobiota bacterium]
MPQTILVVEDDRDISELIQYHLRREGFLVQAVLDGIRAVETVAEGGIDLVLLDLMIPGMDGLQVCRSLKQRPKSAGIPIIMLTAKGEEADIVSGLQAGADDYIPKPFSPKVLMARIRAVLRRADISVGKDPLRECGDVVLDLPKRKATVGGRGIPLTTLEFDILEFLSRAPGRVFTRDQILEGVWKEGKFIIDRAVDVHIRALRKKLGRFEDLIGTVRGVGYRLKEMEP